MKSLITRIRLRWLAAAVGLAAVAFLGGFAFGLFDSGLLQAQSDEHPQDTILPASMVVTPVNRIPEMDTSRNPIKVVTPTPTSASSSGSGAEATKGSPEPAGRYLYLDRIDKYYSLPDDVTLRDIHHFYSCPLDPDIRCPVTPLYIYRRGDAEIGIDSMGEIFTNWDEADASVFPFFTGGN